MGKIVRSLRVETTYHDDELFLQGGFILIDRIVQKGQKIRSYCLQLMWIYLLIGLTGRVEAIHTYSNEDSHGQSYTLV